MNEQPLGAGFVPAQERSPARRWWWFYPVATAAALGRLATQHVEACRLFGHDPVLDDRGARELLLEARLHPGEPGSFARERLRVLVERTVQGVTVSTEARSR